MSTVTKQNKNLTNQELAERFKEELATGSPVVIHIQDSKNPLYSAAFIAQQKANPDPILEFFLGFNGIIIRGVQNVAKSQLEANKQLADMIVEGGILKGFDIHIEDSLEPTYKDQNPKTRVMEGVEEIQINNDGQPVYRNISLVVAGSKTDAIYSGGKWVAKEETSTFNALTGSMEEAKA